MGILVPRFLSFFNPNIYISEQVSGLPLLVLLLTVWNGYMLPGENDDPLIMASPVRPRQQLLLTPYHLLLLHQQHHLFQTPLRHLSIGGGGTVAFLLPE